MRILITMSIFTEPSIDTYHPTKAAALYITTSPIAQIIIHTQVQSHEDEAGKH
jgi:hypothetical protein